jgi:hypothetical protein
VQLRWLTSLDNAHGEEMPECHRPHSEREKHAMAATLLRPSLNRPVPPRHDGNRKNRHTQRGGSHLLSSTING